MSHPELVVLGYSEAAMYVHAAPAPRVAGIISIHGSREFGVETTGLALVPRRLDLTFDDVEVPEAGDVTAVARAASRARFAAANGLAETPPTPADVEAIVAFAREVQREDGVVLCHCGAGMSRAPAAGLICLAVWRGAGQEEQCMREIERVRRGAMPHTGLMRFADEALGRGGKLREAVLRHARNQQ
jgi:predicted protein tyrosine phosphatase